MKGVFLKAGWYNLIMINYEVPPELLKPFLPCNTELDFWQNKCYMSLVGFQFANTKVLGCKIPFHSDFEEVNLRFYIKQKVGSEWKRGVVFIKEIVPRYAIAWIANVLYSEHYICLPMKHTWQDFPEKKEVEYAWKFQGVWNSINVRTEKMSMSVKEGSEEEFITEHYWGYTRINEKTTSLYQVEHPKWNIFKVLDYNINCNFSELYGKAFAAAMVKPASVFLAEGSEIVVRGGRKL